MKRGGWRRCVAAQQQRGSRHGDERARAERERLAAEAAARHRHAAPRMPASAAYAIASRTGPSIPTSATAPGSRAPHRATAAT